MIHVYGNSHTQFFTGAKPFDNNSRTKLFHGVSLGPCVAYNFYDKYYPQVAAVYKKQKLAEGDHVMLCIGEIDCRYHIARQVHLQKRDYVDLVHECVERYFRSYKHLREECGVERLIGWGSHATTTAGHCDHIDSPVWGPCEFRNKIALEWSDYTEYLCELNGIPFVSIVRDMIDENGLTKMDMMRDYCHLDHKVLPMVIDLFQKKGLLPND